MVPLPLLLLPHHQSVYCKLTQNALLVAQQCPLLIYLTNVFCYVNDLYSEWAWFNVPNDNSTSTMLYYKIEHFRMVTGNGNYVAHSQIPFLMLIRIRVAGADLPLPAHLLQLFQASIKVSQLRQVPGLPQCLLILGHTWNTSPSTGLEGSYQIPESACVVPFSVEEISAS